MQTKEQKTLELIKAALAGETILHRGVPSMYIGNSLIKAIIDDTDRYSIKPKTKTVNYQTRLYSLHGNIYAWNSTLVGNSVGMSQAEMENCYTSPSFKWLAPTQEHTCECEVK